jgi:hypothetical protein
VLQAARVQATAAPEKEAPTSTYADEFTKEIIEEESK